MQNHVQWMFLWRAKTYFHVYRNTRVQSVYTLAVSNIIQIDIITTQVAHKTVLHFIGNLF